MALVLCGGLGTRLRAAVADRPKALAPVAGRPFLAWLLDRLVEDGIARTVLCTGYRSEAIEETFGGSYRGMEIIVSREREPLGTGGALRLALPRADGDELLVLNGDSFCDLAPSRLVARLHELADEGYDAKGVIALVQVGDTARYGRVDLAAGGAISRFVEKGGERSAGWINAGLYCLRREVVEKLLPGRSLSLEHDVFPELVGQGLFGLRVEAGFVDIGTPAALESAQGFFARRTAGAGG